MRRLWPTLPPLLALLLVALASAAPRTAADDLPIDDLVDDRTLEAVEAGLRFLARTQNADGSWSSDAGKKINDRYKRFDNGADVPHVGITSLAILAFLAGGHVPGRGPYGALLDRALDFVLEQVQPSGYVASHGTRMYSHALATLALAEIYGVTRNDRVRARLTDAVEFTRKCQNPTGGWRYVPFTQDSDMSVTVCQVVALRAARNVGIKVPRATIDRALRYVIESAITDRPPRGAFYYQPADQRFNRDSFALTAAGLTTLFQAGLYDDRMLHAYVEGQSIPKYPSPRIQDCVNYMRATYVRIQRDYPEHYFYYYGNYYAAQAMYQIGGRQPEVWSAWYRQVRDDLLRQTHWGTSPGTGEREAWWRSNVDTSHAYGTSTALLILQFPLDQLPIHQR